jgi:hypothetical protein
MENLQKLWDFLDGKKSTIAGMVLFLSVFLREVIKGFWSYDPNWMEPLIKTLDWLGGVGFTGAIIHKGVKSLNLNK